MLATLQYFTENAWLFPAIVFVAGLFLGLFFEYIVLPLALRIAKRTNWQLDDIFLGSFRKIALIWFTCIGAHFAVHAMPVNPRLGEGIDTAGVFDSILLIIFIGSVTIYAMRIAVAALALYTKKSGRTTQGVTLFTNVTKVVIVILGVLTTLEAFNKPIAPILTALGVGGLAVALALQDTLSNLFAGFHILASRQIKQDDYIKLEGGQEGYVADINWRNTTIRTPTNNMVIVPNSKLAAAIITNFDKPDKEVAIGLEITVNRSSDLEKVERVTCEVADAIISTTEGVINSGPAAIRYSSINDAGVTFGVGFRIKGFMDQYLVKHKFIMALHARYKTDNIEVAMPERLVYAKASGTPQMPL